MRLAILAYSEDNAFQCSFSFYWVLFLFRSSPLAFLSWLVSINHEFAPKRRSQALILWISHRFSTTAFYCGLSFLHTGSPFKHFIHSMPIYSFWLARWMQGMSHSDGSICQHNDSYFQNLYNEGFNWNQNCRVTRTEDSNFWDSFCSSRTFTAADFSSFTILVWNQKIDNRKLSGYEWRTLLFVSLL